MKDKQSRELRIINLSLIRKRSEHNEGMVSNLEEIALHQEELEAVGTILGRTCGKTLRILLLQNNVISKMNHADFRQFRVLEYLNLALNNIEVIENIQHLECLNKLDFTLNFINVDKLEESIETLKSLRKLRELHLMGNPCCGKVDTGANSEFSKAEESVGSQEPSWKGYRMYVIANLHQLENLDGIMITRSERIKATQQLSLLTKELRILAKKCEEIKERANSNTCHSKKIDHDDLTAHTPEVRSQISNEMFAQKVEKEASEKANEPKNRGELEFHQEQNEAIQRARKRELEGKILQCNEGKWKFSFDDEKKPGFLLFDVALPKFLSSSLIDVDIHPTYISLVIKSKTLRLVLPTEVKSNESTAQRSKTTGHLLLTMPKVNPHEITLYSKDYEEEGKNEDICDQNNNTKKKDAMKLKKMTPDAFSKKNNIQLDMMEVSSKIKTASVSKLMSMEGKSTVVNKHSFDEEDEPPPIF